MWLLTAGHLSLVVRCSLSSEKMRLSFKSSLCLFRCLVRLVLSGLDSVVYRDCFRCFSGSIDLYYFYFSQKLSHSLFLSFLSLPLK